MKNPVGNDVICWYKQWLTFTASILKWSNECKSLAISSTIFFPFLLTTFACEKLCMKWEKCKQLVEYMAIIVIWWTVVVHQYWRHWTYDRFNRVASHSFTTTTGAFTHFHIACFPFGYVFSFSLFSFSYSLTYSHCDVIEKNFKRYSLESVFFGWVKGWFCYSFWSS